jgi:hypothetical protein
MAVSLAMVMVQQVMSLSNGDLMLAMSYWGAAWRSVLTGGVVLLLLGIGMGAYQRYVPPGMRLGGERLLKVVAVLVGLGILGTAGVFAMAAMLPGEELLNVMRWLLAGALPMAVAMLPGGMVLWRSMRLIR